MELTAEYWNEALSKKDSPAPERVVLTGHFSKKLKIPKAEWKTHFDGWKGLGFRKGKEIELAKKAKGGPSVDIPEWARTRLAKLDGEANCVTERRGKFYHKKLKMEPVRSEIPGCTVIDTFAPFCVTRSYSANTDFYAISMARLEELLREMGTFKRDPFAPFKDMSGRIGMLARRDLLRTPTLADDEEAASCRLTLLSSQKPNGSWDDSALVTAYNITRMLETGAPTTDQAIERGVAWMLEAAEPFGFPGLFMIDEKLTAKFNAWKVKQARGKSARPHRESSQKERLAYLQNRDVCFGVNADPCDLRLTWTSAVAVEVLLRCGLHAHERVVKAVNTLMAMGNGWDWCGSEYFDTRESNYVDESTDPPDFNKYPVATRNREESLDWFDGAEEILDYRCDGEARKAVKIGPKAALLSRVYRSTCECAMLVRRALTFHPDYEGSSFETNVALACSWYQGAHGGWGDAYMSSVCGILQRTEVPLAAFLVLRSVPMLIRTQGKDGLWQEKPAKGCPPPKKAESSYLILRALRKFGFLDELRR